MPPGRPTPPPERTTPVREAGDHGGRRDALAHAIPRPRAVSWWVGLILAAGFAAVVTPAITAERWPLQLRAGTIRADRPAPFTVRAPMLAGYDALRVRGGVVVARGETARGDEAAIADAIAEGMPRGPILYLALFGLTWALAALFTRALQRSARGRLLRVQLVSLAAVAVLAVAAKLVLLATAASALVIPVAVLALVPALALDRGPGHSPGRIVGLATGVLAALVVSLLAPFDLGLAILLVVQAAAAGAVVAVRPRRRWLAAVTAGLAAAVCTSASYVVLAYLTGGPAPELRDPLHAPWLAAAIGPALAGLFAAPLVPIYQRLIGEITRRALARLDDLGHPLLRQIAERAPGTWQHSLMIANMGERAAEAIGADGRLVRVGAYFHDLGKSLQPTYFVENLEPGATSPHDRLPPEVSCDAMFAHAADGIAAARKARLHERVIDFMHMHHGRTVLEPLWARCQSEGNPNGFTIERFRYPGPAPQSRETAIVALCDALEVASRALHHPDSGAIDALVERTVQGAVRRGQLDDSGLSAAELRQIGDALGETLRPANRRDARPAAHDTSAAATAHTVPLPRLHDDERGATVTPSAPAGAGARTRPAPNDDALANTADLVTANERVPASLHARAASGAPEARIRARAAVRAPTARDASADLDASRTGRAPAFSSAAHDAHAADAVERSARESARTIDAARAEMAGDAPAAAPDGSFREPVRAGNEIVTIVPRRHAAERPRASPPPAQAPMLVEQAVPPAPKPGPLPPPPDLITPSMFRAVPPTPPPLAAPPLATQPLATQPAAPSPAGPPAGSQPLPAAMGRGLAPGRGHPRPRTAPPVVPTRHPTADPSRIADATLPPDAAKAGDAGNATKSPDAASALDAIARPVVADPAQIAAALAAIVSRVSAAPFGMPRSPSSDAPGDPPAAGGESATATAGSTPIDDDSRATQPRMATQPAPLDASTTEPSIPALAIGDERSLGPPAPAPAQGTPAQGAPARPWSSELASRVEAALVDEWAHETPVVAPTSAELRALFGQPDVTRQLPVDEVEQLQRRAAELAEADRQRRTAELAKAEPRRRTPPPTAEVDPEDIEAAIELAPPARRPAARNTIGVNRPKKPERPE